MHRLVMDVVTVATSLKITLVDLYECMGSETMTLTRLHQCEYTRHHQDPPPSRKPF